MEIEDGKQSERREREEIWDRKQRIRNGNKDRKWKK